MTTNNDNLSVIVEKIGNTPETGLQVEVGTSQDVELVFPSGDHFAKLQEKLAHIEEAKPVFKVKPEYKKWQEKEKSRGLFLGLVNRPGRNPGSTIPAVTWLAKEANGYVVYEDGSYILVDEVSKGKARGVITENVTLLEIEYLGEKQTKSNNKSKNFEVRVLA